MSDLVQCACCGSYAVHHTQVTSHDRDTDDADSVSSLHACSDGYARTHGIRTVETTNPSRRRSGVVIVFLCESCGGLTEFRVAQHKGQSWIDTRPWSRDA